MLWSATAPAAPQLPAGYALRIYAPEDETALRALLSIDTPPLNAERWQEYRDKLLPPGPFLVAEQGSNKLVATAAALHNPNPGRYYFPFGGELGYLSVDPAHQGQNLGNLLAAMAVRKFLDAGYSSIRAAVQGFRLPAIKIYLKAGFVPFLHEEGLEARWQRICVQLNWDFTPGDWPRRIR
jgi:mycothiol synthase